MKTNKAVNNEDMVAVSKKEFGNTDEPAQTEEGETGDWRNHLMEQLARMVVGGAGAPRGLTSDLSTIYKI